MATPESTESHDTSEALREATQAEVEAAIAALDADAESECEFIFGS